MRDNLNSVVRANNNIDKLKIETGESLDENSYLQYDDGYLKFDIGHGYKCVKKGSMELGECDTEAQKFTFEVINTFKNPIRNDSPQVMINVSTLDFYMTASENRNIEAIQFHKKDDSNLNTQRFIAVENDDGTYSFFYPVDANGNQSRFRYMYSAGLVLKISYNSLVIDDTSKFYIWEEEYLKSKDKDLCIRVTSWQ